MNKIFNINIPIFTIIKVLLVIPCAFIIFPNTHHIITDMTKKDIIRIELIGDDNLSLNLNEEYEEMGAEIFVNDIKSDLLYHVNGEVDITKPGIYEIIYSIENESIKRKITVIDNIPPVITLKEKKEIIIFKDEPFKEPGYTATDNIDGDITSKVEITGEVNNKKAGKYVLTYKVTDSYNNTADVQRTITVKEKLIVKHVTQEIKDNPPKPQTSFNNEIMSMQFTSNGIDIKGHYNADTNILKLIETNSKTEYSYNTITTNNIFTSSINLSDLENGTYTLYINNTSEEKLLHKLDDVQKIVRAKVGNKLVTITYPNDNVVIDIKNFSYIYDILIDVGHGGNDPGATNHYMTEKQLNLIVSNYEKERYEQHGLKVLLTRTDDSYGLAMGNTSWVDVRRRGYAVGYYGVVSKVVYSNHHNSSPNSKLMGWEILVPATFNKDQLKEEHKIVNAWNQFYTLKENHTRFYTRNYDNDAIYNKINGEIYNFNNYYALNRLPFNLFNVKSVIYEGCYMSNNDNFNWYYNEGNWKKVSEAKIKVYVESLGVTYIPPTY